ncbi:JmjC domain-containing protein [Streptomyces sp. Ncost-T10-10d]|uniref:JmjC domain-containing protein n=1 Tax=Streptomyces sp. Ncost-T10-10d TaxID=1839774 RepID=UPI00159F063B|nr:cupin domain-containing protein [Streptomyces sp. Ncost-T10-10d]
MAGEDVLRRTPAGTRGRPLHRDDADVLAIQISGEKRWRVHAGPADGNWEPAREDGDPGEVLLETVLRPGEVLYVPRGFAHHADAVGDAPSVHLSLTVREAGTANLYALLQALLADGAAIPGRPLDDEALTDAAEALIGHTRRTPHCDTREPAREGPDTSSTCLTARRGGDKEGRSALRRRGYGRRADAGPTRGVAGGPTRDAPRRKGQDLTRVIWEMLSPASTVTG